MTTIELLRERSPQHLGTLRTTTDHTHPLGGIALHLGGGLARRADLLGSPDWAAHTVGDAETFTVPFTPGEEDIH
ncbi:hypothetical protein ABT095_04010 [Kitasatospora sp. NPDC002227]|uniref:hypothetical protein n=1 Tax=Kitasatospora sp. NPDC002227 TaxID=3154773 RepID=UPI0033190472